MIANIVNVIAYLIILGLVWWLCTLLPLPHPIGLIVQVLFIILAILIVLSLFGLVPIGVPRLYK